MDPVALAAAVTIMAAIVTGLMAMYQSTASPRSAMDRRLGSLLGESSGFDVIPANVAALRPKRTGRLPIISTLLSGKAWTAEMGDRLDRADIRLTVSEYVALRLLVALFAGLGVVLTLGSGIVGLAVMGAALTMGYILPAKYVAFAQGRRLKKLTEQLPETLSLVSNSLKAGFGLMQSLDLASRELAHPMATELRRALNDINVGSRTEEALQAMAKRSGSDDLDIVITAMLVQQSTGGNLAEILDNVGHTMRERIRIRGEIKTLTTQQVFTGVIIGGLPFVMIVLFSLINPAYMAPLFTELAGKVMLGIAAMLQLFGIIMIKRILAIEV